MFLMRPGRRMARAAVGTAVVVGTAGAVRHHQDQKYANQADQQAAQQQTQDNSQQMAEMQAQQQQLAMQQQQLAQQQAALAQQKAAPAQVAAPAGSMTDDKIAQLQKMAELQKQGILTPEEFAAQKAKILAS